MCKFCSKIASIGLDACRVVPSACVDKSKSIIFSRRHSAFAGLEMHTNASMPPWKLFSIYIYIYMPVVDFRVTDLVLQNLLK